MDASAIYMGLKKVRRIYLGGMMIWPPTTELSLSVINSLLSDGYHVLQAQDAILLSSHEDVISAIMGHLSTPQAVALNGTMESKTRIEGYVFPADAVFCVCDAASATQAEINALVSEAVSVAAVADLVTVEEIQAFVANAALCACAEDMVTDAEAAVLVAGAVRAAHREDIETTNEASAHIAGAVYGEHREDISVEHESSAVVGRAGFMPVISEDSQTQCEASMLTFRASDIMPLDAAEENKAQADAALDVPEAVEIGALLHLVSTCEISMAVANAAGMSVVEASKTSIEAVLSFEGEIEKDWYDPVQRGSDLYIRQTYEDPLQEGTNLDISEVFFPPVQDGSNLYIISGASLGGE